VTGIEPNATLHGLKEDTKIISHRIGLDRAPDLYKIWRDRKENVTKIVIGPWAA
jgi:threonine dehydrogenase-like Zn-dependent dehydrogenase